MGTTISVSSSVYNLAGDVNKRANFLKTTVIGAVLNEADIPQTITDSYLRGPGIKLKSFARWSRTQGYANTVGLTTGAFTTGQKVNSQLIAEQIPVGSGQAVSIQKAEIGQSDFLRWADQYMLQNFPLEAQSNWLADFDESSQLITIRRTNGSVAVFSPLNFEMGKQYLYVDFSYIVEASVGPLVTGSLVQLATGAAFPLIENGITVSDDTVSNGVSLATTTKTKTTYSDNRPEENTTSTTNASSTYSSFTRVFTSIRKMGTKPSGEPYSIESIHNQFQTGTKIPTDTVSTATSTITGGVTKTVVTTVTTESIRLNRSYRVDTRERTGQSYSDNQVMIYAKGQGNAVLDAMFTAGGNMGTFFPYIPMRINNTFVSPTYYSEVYTASVKAFRKAVAGKYDKVIETIAANPQLGDIDYTYVVFGVALNTKEKEAMRYLYTFFEVCASQSTGGISFAAWMVLNQEREAAYQAELARLAYERETRNEAGTTMYYDPIRQTWTVEPQPNVPPYLPPPSFTLNISSGNNPAMNYNITLTWAGMGIASGTGLGRAGAKVGDLWFEQLADVSYVEHTSTMRMEEGQIYYDPIDVTVNLERINLVFQESVNRWKRITILGLVHNNLIYSGRSVTIYGKEALNDPEESGFIIPLHEQIYADTPLVSRTQMATSCCYLMFNCYNVVKRKWYQSGLFAVLLVIVIIVVAINYPPAAAALSGGGGILGGNIAVGAALGFAGLAAVVAGVAANAIAAVILMKVIGAGATALFGEKLGQIIGFIASVVAMQAGTMYAAGKEITMSTMYSTMMKAENLLKLTLSAGDAVGNYIRAGTMEIIADTKDLMDKYKESSDEIAQAYENEFGIGNGGVIDPMQLTDIGSVMYEPSETFLSRTLMTGTDIVGISLGMITNFSKLTLNLDLET